MVEKAARFVIFAASAFISSKYADGYWVVGPVFGLAVVCWDSNTFRQIVAIRHAAYLAASTLIYALVYHVSRQNWNRGSDLQESLIGSLPIAVIIGSILLPLAHKALLSATSHVIQRTIPLLILSYYLVTAVSWANDHWEWGWRINFLMVAIGAWQGVYLYSLKSIAGDQPRPF